jgi:hypothetical protein
MADKKISALTAATTAASANMGFQLGSALYTNTTITGGGSYFATS